MHFYAIKHGPLGPVYIEGGCPGPAFICNSPNRDREWAGLAIF